MSISTEYSYCLLDCSGIGKQSQGANINISLNLMYLRRNVTALTFNIHQIIENYMTPISHFDVHGTWAVCIWLTSSFVTGLPLCNVILSSKPSLLIAAHLCLFHEYVSVPILLPLKKLLQPRLALVLRLLSSPADNAAKPWWPHCYDQLQSPAWCVPIFCLCRPLYTPWGWLSWFVFLIAKVSLPAPKSRLYIAHPGTPRWVQHWLLGDFATCQLFISCGMKQILL